MHARKAWLQGLSPKQNRTVPPLRHDDVHRLKRDFPHLRIETNGGVTTMEEVRRHLAALDGVMIGRAAADDPMLFAGIDREIYGDATAAPTSVEVALAMIEDVERLVASGEPARRVLRHMAALFHGARGARRWRRHLAEAGARPGAGGEVIWEALELVQRSA